MRRVLSLCRLLLILSLFLGTAASGGNAGMVGSIGTVTIDGKQWQRLSLRPEIPVWRFGVALDIELFIDNQGHFSKKGWNFESPSKTAESLLRKVYYVRYGHPGERTFIKAGALDNVTLGYGLIMEGYCNTLEYPGVKRLGIQFDVRDISPFEVGIQGMINDFQDLGGRGGLVGLRISARPAAPRGVFPIKDLEFGATYVIDIDQYGGLRDSDGDGYPDEVDDFPKDKSRWVDTDGDGVEDAKDFDADGDGILDADYFETQVANYLEGVGVPVDRDVKKKSPFKLDGSDAFSMVGLDVGIPVVNLPPLRIDLYGQYARVIDDDDLKKAKGSGTAAPGVRILLEPVLAAKVEYRRFKGEFESEYFNRLYELDRARVKTDGSVETKDSTLDSMDLRGVFGKVGVKLDDLITISAGYQYMMDTEEKDQSLTAEALLGSAILNQLPRISYAAAYYQKRRIDTRKYAFFEPTPQTTYGYRVGLDVSPGVILLWHTQYTYTLDEEGKVRPERFVSIETTMEF
ncbi:MAG TPA: hypothetical protein EYP53_03595 [Candidatus Latescibacteria bacterium]|nr:hypothetical protein [Candidatus Latescibacterota bacterium]